MPVGVHVSVLALGHANLGIRSVYLQGLDNSGIIDTVQTRAGSGAARRARHGPPNFPTRWVFTNRPRNLYGRRASGSWIRRSRLLGGSPSGQDDEVHAIATMGAGRAAANLLIRIEWASSRPAIVKAPPSIAFGPASLPVMREAVSHLQQLGPFDNELVEGVVRRLTRDYEDEIGTIVIEGEARGVKRNVHVELPDEQYGMAVDAHRSKRPVRIRGTLFKQGRSWVLSDPGQLAFED